MDPNQIRAIFQVQLVCGSIIMTHFKQMEIGDGVSLLEIG